MTDPLPSSTRLTIVFPRDEDSGKFDRGVYSEALTGSRVSSQQIDQYLSEVDAILAVNTKGNSCFHWIFFLTLIASIGGALGYLQSDPNATPGIVWGCLAGFWVVSLFWMAIKETNQVEKSKKQIESLNANAAFSSNGLNWNLPKSFPKWIELQKNYLLFPNMNDGQGQVWGNQPQAWGNYQAPNVGQAPNNFYPPNTAYNTDYGTTDNNLYQGLVGNQQGY